LFFKFYVEEEIFRFRFYNHVIRLHWNEKFGMKKQ